MPDSMENQAPLTNEKSAKYDRQLRLWGNHGQNNLEKSRVCLINATAVGKYIYQIIKFTKQMEFTLATNCIKVLRL